MGNTKKIDELLKKAGYDEKKEILAKFISENERSHPEVSIEYARVYYDLMESKDDLIGMGYAYFRIGAAYYYLSDFEKYLENTKTALEIYEKAGSQKHIAEALNGIGLAYMELLKYSESQEYLLKSLVIREREGNRSGMASSYQNIGLILCRLDQHDKALEYFHKALKIHEESGNSSKIAMTLNNIASTHYDLGDIEKAILIFERSYRIKKKENNKIGMAATLANLAGCYKMLKKYDIALDKLFESLKIYKEISAEFGYLDVLLEAGKIYLEIGDECKGLKYLEESKERAEKCNCKKNLKNIYLTYSEFYAKNGDYENAYRYSVKYSRMKDEINKENTDKKIFEVQVKFDVERKEKEAELHKIQSKLFRAKNVELSELVKEKTKKIVDMEKFFEVGKFSASIVHNLNNPLSSLVGGIELLKLYMNEENMQDKDVLKCFRIIEKSSDNISSMIKSITANVRNRKYEKNVALDLNEVITESLNFLKIDNNLKKNYIFKTDLVLNINKIMGQEIYFYQIFSNLFKNAIDAMQFSDEKVLTIMTQNIDKTSFSITIKDSGSGIKKDDLDKLFVTGFTTKAPGKGTGLGLAIVKQMVESYKGIIEVDSEEGKGTTFIIKFPGIMED